MKKNKVVLLGDEAAGKTSLVRRYMYDTYDDSIQATIGMDFQTKCVTVDDRSVKLQLWDTAGQERFRSLIPSYIRDARAAVVVYDVTQPTALEATTKWIEEARNATGGKVTVALVGNKVDLIDERKISTEDGKAHADSIGAHFTETSAKLGENVPALFHMIAASMPNDKDESTVAESATQEAPIVLVAEKPSEEKKKKSCAC